MNLKKYYLGFLIIALMISFCGCKFEPIEVCGCVDEIINSNEILKNNEDVWNLELNLTNVSDVGLSINFNKKEGKIDAGLMTGSFFIIEVFKDGEWVELEYRSDIEGDVAWNSIGYLILEDGSTKLEETWEWLYGKLEEGSYRIGKEVLKLKEDGTHDIKRFWSEFEIK